MAEKSIEIQENEVEFETGLSKKDIGNEGIIFLNRLKEKKKISLSFDMNENLLMTTKDYVGSFLIPGIEKRINIYPKIFNEDEWKQLSWFLSFADHGTLDYFEGDNIVEFGDDANLIDIIHYRMIERYDELEKQGLLKSYVVHTENSSSLHGKLLMHHQMINDMMRRPKFFCEFDELEYDTKENRVILQALAIVERTSEIQTRKMQALDRAQRLSGVVQKIEVTAPERERMMRSYNRQTYRYREIHEICDKIIRDSGVDDIFGGDVTSVAPKLYDMDREFEKFLENLFIKYGPWDHKDVRFQKKEKSWIGLGETTDRNMKPDITIWKNGECTQIIDAKYKTKEISANDLYQLGFYMYEYGKDKIDEAYAIAPESDERKSVEYTAEKSGKKVYVKRLNISECLKLIKNKEKGKLEELIKWLTCPSNESFNYFT